MHTYYIPTPLIKKSVGTKGNKKMQKRPLWFSANQALHHHVKASYARAWRQAGYDAATAADLPYFTDPIIVVATIHKQTAREYDPGNLYSSVKPALDGLCTDADRIQDDSEHWVHGPFLVNGTRATDKRGGITITILDLATERHLLPDLLLPQA